MEGYEILFVYFSIIFWLFIIIGGAALIGLLIKMVVKLFSSNSKNVNSTKGFINTEMENVKRSISKKFNEQKLTGCTWMVVNDLDDDTLYTFRAKNQLIITTNGNVKRAKYELIVENDSIIISKDELDEQFNMEIINDEFLFLNKVSTKDWLLLANQSKFVGESKREIYNQYVTNLR